MQISEIHIFQKDLPVIGGPYTMALSTIHAVDSTIIKLVADNGLVGWGETCPLGSTYQPQHAKGARAALVELAPGMIGASPLGFVEFYRRMNTLLNGHLYAKAAFDIAAHDLAAKHYGVRVADLLGGPATELLPSYFASGVGEPDEIARLTLEKRRQGFPRIQLKVGRSAVEKDIETVRKVWEAVGNSMKIAVDANRGWSVRDVLRVSRECMGIPITIEQPCNTIEEVAAVHSKLQHPVFLDESAEDIGTVLRAVGENICDGFGLKVTRVGGLNAMKVIRDVCEVRSMPHTCDDAWGGDIIAAACAHIGATVQPRLLEGVWIAQPYIDEHYDPEGGIKIEDGHIRLPSGPGLGIVPDENVFGAPVASFA